jgi:hypothetical protein
MLAVTRPGAVLFVTSLFSSFITDVTSSVVEFHGEDLSRPSWGPYYYNIYSMERFKWYCRSFGARSIIDREFEIDMDLQCSNTGMGTYTRTLAGRKRLQSSGPLHMPWRFAAIFT